MYSNSKCLQKIVANKQLHEYYKQLKYLGVNNCSVSLAKTLVFHNLFFLLVKSEKYNGLDLIKIKSSRQLGDWVYPYIL